MAKKKSKSSTSKKSKSASKSSAKKSSKTAKQEEPQPLRAHAPYELEDEHRVLSHLMYILFLFAAGFAALFTAFLFTQLGEMEYAGIKALVLLGWAFLFKTFGHRMHYPHH